MVKNKNKHFCVIVSCLLSVMVAIFPLLSVNNEKTTANADGIISDNYLVVLPSVYFSYRGIENCVMPEMFFSITSDNTALFYFVSSFDGSVGRYVSSSFPLNTLTESPGRVHFLRSLLSEDNKLKTVYIDSGFSSYVRFYGDFTKLNSVSRVSVYRSNNTDVSSFGLTYFFQDTSGDVPVTYFGVEITTFDDSLTFSDNLRYFNFTSIASPVDINNLNQYLYDTGYTTGYNNGYDTGYNRGLNSTWGDLSPWQYVVNGVNDFLSIKLFGDVSISIILSVAFGCILLGYAIKVFLGG